MRVELLFIISLLAFLVVHFSLLPWCAARLVRRRSTEGIGWHGAYAAFTALRSLSFASCIVSLVLFLVLWGVDLLGGTAVQELERSLHLLKIGRDVLLPFSLWWALFSAGLALVGAVIFSVWDGRRQMQKALSRSVQLQMDQFIEQINDGTLSKLPPTPDMERISQLIGETSAVREAIETDAELDETQRCGLLLEQDSFLDKLKTAYINLDFDRRLDPTIAEAEIQMPRPRNVWERIQLLLISRGALRTKSGISNLVRFAALAALIPSLLCFSSSANVASLEKRIDNLHEARLQLQVSQANTSIDASLSQPTSSAALSQADEATLHEAAEHFRQSAMSNRSVGQRAVQSEFSLRSAATRQRILSAAATKSKGTFEATAWIAEDTATPPLERKLARELISNVGDDALQKSVSTDVFDNLQRAAKNPDFMSRLRRDLGSLQRPARFEEILTGTARGQAVQQVSSSGAKLATKESQARAATAVADYITGKSDLKVALERAATPDALLTEVTTKDMVQMRNRIRDIQGQGVEASRSLQSRLRNQPPSAVEKAIQGGDQPKTISAIDRLRTRQLGSGGPRNDRMADVLSGYRDYFPEHPGAELKTARGKLLSQWNGLNKESVAVKNSFSRARNYEGLRGFSRVGGVLIGRQAQEVEAHFAKQNSVEQAASDISEDVGPILPCRDIQWIWSKEGLLLILVDDRGGEHRTRIHRPRVVEQALSYAADGRPLAVTIVNAEPLPFRQILVHPTLVGTPLGRRAIEIDQWVYRYLKDEAEFESRRVIDGHNLLYQLAQAARAAELGETDNLNEKAAELVKHGREDGLAALKWFQENPQRKELDELTQKALANPGLLADPARSPLPKMVEYFDPNLVKSIQEAARKSDAVDEFIQHVRIAARASWEDYIREDRELKQEVAAAKLTGASQGDINRWKAWDERLNKRLREIFGWAFPAPEYQEASGVRESPFSLRFSELIPDPDRPLPTAILEFTVQLAFNTPAYFGANDRDPLPGPFEFAAIQPLVDRKVAAAVAASPTNQQIAQDLAEFAWLQRLFRTALAGNLGPEFPVERLAKLAEEIGERLPPQECHTAHWDFGETKRPGDAQVEMRLALGLLQNFEIELANQANRRDDISTEDLRTALVNLQKKLAGESAKPNPLPQASGVSGLGGVIAHVVLLIERLEQVSSTESAAQEVANNTPPDRDALQAAWEQHLARTANWRRKWDGAKSELQEQPAQNGATRAATNSSPEQKLRNATKLMLSAHDQYQLQDEFQMQEDARRAFEEAYFGIEKLPAIE